MRVAAFVLLNMCAWTLVGCIVAEETPANEEVSNELEANAWTDLEFSMAGAAGEWVWAYQTLPAPVSEVNMDYDVYLEVKGDGKTEWSALLLRPALVHNMDGDRSLQLWRTQAIVRTGDYDTGERWGSGSYSSAGEFETVAFAFAATAPWNLTISLELESSGTPLTVSPESIVTGGGMTNSKGDPGMLPVAGPVGQMTYEEDAEAPGWSHFTFISKRLNPTRIQSTQASFASGAASGGVGASYGYSIPPDIRSLAREGWGEAANVAGRNTLEITFAAAEVAEKMVFMHVVGAADGMPPGLSSTHYQSRGLPFFADYDTEGQRVTMRPRPLDNPNH